jgi:hypothetical protein
MEFIPTKPEYLAHPSEPQDIYAEHKYTSTERHFIDWLIKRIVKKEYWQSLMKTRFALRTHHA